MTEENIKTKLQRFTRHRNRHHSHVVGDVLCYQCDHVGTHRQGVVLNVLKHYSITYYVLEVETGPPINESFLHLVSEFQVKG